MKIKILILFFLLSLAIKSQINLQWARTYNNGPIDTLLWPIDMAIDDSGSVFVTGFSIGYKTYYDIATVKYDPAGNQKWVARYNAPDSSYDRPWAIHVDKMSNVYIAAQSTDSGEKMLTLKYNSMGVLQWQKPIGSLIQNIAHDITTDDSGFVYVSGTTRNYTLTLIKYDKNGNQIWLTQDSTVFIQNAPTQIVIDSVKNVYVLITDYNLSPVGCKLIKYNYYGKKVWEQIYYGSTNGAGPADLKISKAGNLFVLANTQDCGFNIIKYAPTGGLIWASNYDNNVTYTTATNSGFQMAIDKNENVFATGTVFPNSTVADSVCTIKFNANGTFSWVKTYTGGNRWDKGNDIKIDKFGYVYITSQVGSYNDTSFSDVYTIKYDQNGNQIWAIRYNSKNYEEGFKIAVNNLNGDVYCFGYQQDATTGNVSFLTLKYSQLFTGIQELATSPNILIYPNPVLNTLFVLSEQNFDEGTEMEIRNSLGQSVFKKSFNKEIEISELASGYYILNISSPKHEQVHVKFIKE